MDVGRFRQQPILGIVRGVQPDAVEPLVETIIACGLKTIEITMNTPAAAESIERAVAAANGRLTIGAGTVLTRDDLRSALVAGATFIVMPTLVPDVMKHCVKKGIPVFPGALTPQEIFNAWRAGATMVKVFPAKFFGPEYLREIKGPFHDIELLAVGGVTPANIRSFFSCGASAVAFGGSVFQQEWLASRDFARIGQGIKAIIAGYQKGQ